MTAPGLIRAREAYARRAWREAHAAYAEERAAGTLAFTDFENHGTTAHLIGDNELSREILAEGYREGIRRGEPTWAARMAFWIGHGLIFDGGMSQAAGWFARARQLLAGRDADCAEAGFVRIPDGVGLMESGDPEAAVQVFREILALASTLGDPQLRAMATFGLGRATIRCGDIEGGMAVLDDVIVAVALGEMPPMVIGDAYCGVLEACHEAIHFSTRARMDRRSDGLVRATARPGALPWPLPGVSRRSPAVRWRLGRSLHGSTASVRLAARSARA